MSNDIKAISLFSGGLDSILATRLVMEQGIYVVAVQFVTPFFNHEILRDVEGHTKRIYEKYGVNVKVVDISRDYMELLSKPVYGFGKNFNPCVDCKIFMLKYAKELMVEIGAKFLFTGEVLGQRPMSQRRDTLNVIERDSGNKTVLLRPLSAKLMKETEAELEGWVDRSLLKDFSGRGRSNQIALAKEYGITDYPTPGGGCLLADPILSKRIKRIYEGEFTFSVDEADVDDIELLLVGRQLLVPLSLAQTVTDGVNIDVENSGYWVIVGRDEAENERLGQLAGKDDILLSMEERPGPTVLLRRVGNTPQKEQQKLVEIAASLVVRYGRKIEGAYPPAEVFVLKAGVKTALQAKCLEDKVFKEWIF